MTRFRSHVLLALTLILAFSAVACKSGRRDDPILRLSADEALQQGKALMEEEKYRRARRLLTHAFEVEPNSRGGREALLLAADAYYLDGGGPDNFIQCEAKYRDFLNRFPTSDRSDYAQFQVARCLASRTEKPDRDQTVTVKALQAFQEVIRLYPTSDFAARAEEEIVAVEDLLAAHELSVANFYATYGRGRICQATIRRLEGLQEQYPDFTRMDEVLFLLGSAFRTCQRPEASTEAWDELEARFPASEYLDKVRKLREREG